MIEWPAKLLTTIHSPHKRATTRSCSTIEYNTDYIPPLPLGLSYLCRFTIHTTFILQTYTFYNVAAPHLHSLQGLLHTYTVLNVAYPHSHKINASKLHCQQCGCSTLTQSRIWLLQIYTVYNVAGSHLHCIQYGCFKLIQSTLWLLHNYT